MTSITAQTHATLDGVIDAPAADALLPYMTDAGRQGALDLALAADALLLARETWQGLAGAWRDQTGPMAERLNAMPKYVVSATLESADDWDHTTIVGYDDIAGLREREQLLTYGCGRLARDLLADGLLDVLVLSLTPVVAGAGGGCSTTPATSSGCGSPTARPSRPAPCGCSSSRITRDRSDNRVLTRCKRLCPNRADEHSRCESPGYPRRAEGHSTLSTVVLSFAGESAEEPGHRGPTGRMSVPTRPSLPLPRAPERA